MEVIKQKIPHKPIVRKSLYPFVLHRRFYKQSAVVKSVCGSDHRQLLKMFIVKSGRGD